MDKYSQYENDQRSQEWLNKFKYSIGGSSIGVFYHKSRYTNWKNFYKGRLKPRRKTIITMYGSYMEDVVRFYLSEKIQSEVKVLGGVPWLVIDDISRIHYSMDGYFHGDASVFHKDFSKGNFLVEIKCPWSRKIQRYKRGWKNYKVGSVKVSNDYLCQMKLGLKVFPELDQALFVDTLVRLCKYEDFDNLNYLDTFPRVEVDKIIDKGFMIFSVDEDQYLDSFVYKRNKNKDYKKGINLKSERIMKDFGYEGDDIDGDLAKTSLHDLFILIDMGILTYYPSYELVDSVGFTSWKIFDIGFQQVERDENFLDDKIDDIIEVSKKLIELNLSDYKDKKDFIKTLND